MLSRNKTIQSVLLGIVSWLGICSGYEQSGSCIRYETYAVFEYKMTRFDSTDMWFRHGVHFSPRKVSRIGIRTRRIYGCCNSGYQYKSFPKYGCEPVCSTPCPANSQCIQPEVCSCDDGYKSVGTDCVLNERTTEAYIATTTVENKNLEPPCNGSCVTNEECSILNDVCVCKSGFQRSSGIASAACVRKCEPSCPENSQCSETGLCTCNVGYHNVSGSRCVSSQPTREEYFSTTTVEPPCNGSCPTNEECSTLDNVCVCKSGFQRSSKPASGNCVRKCDPTCPENSQCSESGQCICNAGYDNVTGPKCVSNQPTTEEYIPTTTVENKDLQPPCNGSCATNEECSASDKACICRDGYQRSASGPCVPKCVPECQHADCIAPNSCSCWPHYERTNSSSCHIQCSELTCVYGECNEEGACVCAPGFLNNGTACAWAGDAILAEPDDCECWSKFVWQKNETEASVQQCLPLCDGDDSIEVDSGCINFKHCQCYEGFLVCQSQIYKCSALRETTSTVRTSQRLAQEVVKDQSSSAILTVAIVSTLGIVSVVGTILWILHKRRRSPSGLWNYGRMGSRQDDEQI